MTVELVFQSVLLEYLRTLAAQREEKEKVQGDATSA
jgi:hypothetical protein